MASDTRRMLRIAGADVPYPEPTTSGASKSGKGNTRTDTKPELALRSALHRSGLRFRKDLRIKLGTFAARPDIVFTKRRVAVFVDGCFWHSCPEHGTSPKSNTDYWLPKLQANVARDRRNDEALEAEGWTVLRIWEHEDVGVAAERVREALGES
ncbi:very short patch repair endonuclease [Aquihabitans daechungensis]|uniref:very short patch repair endonuclease n=1 Tax=Aquihabitans daechungensis TaxID=1052257 RepID=UPI003BA3D843